MIEFSRIKAYMELYEKLKDDGEEYTYERVYGKYGRTYFKKVKKEPAGLISILDLYLSKTFSMISLSTGLYSCASWNSNVIFSFNSLRMPIVIRRSLF